MNVLHVRLRRVNVSLQAIKQPLVIVFEFFPITLTLHDPESLVHSRAIDIALSSAMSSAQALINEATLKRKDGTELKSKQLWEKQPVFLYCIRRPGCVLCRDEAQKLWKEHEVLEAAGMKVVCVVHEWIEREINAFVPEYWAGEIYHDVDKAFYKAFGQGQLRTASALSLLNPFNPAWGRILAARKRVKESNTSGEASILGGLLVVKPDGSIAWMHAEHTFGEFPETAEVLAAAKKAVGAQ